MFFSALASQFLELSRTLYGLMITYKQTGGYKKALDEGCLWMLDNGAFSGNFDEERWLKQLKTLAPYASTCRGIVAPDAVILRDGKFVKGDWRGTAERLERYSPMIRAYGLPVAYALQDDHPPQAVPWDLFDVLFVAGTSEYKESVAAERIAKEAKERGKRVHIGRVSQVRRMDLTWWADSWDGSTFKYGDRTEKHLRFSRAIARYNQGANQYRLL